MKRLSMLIIILTTACRVASSQQPDSGIQNMITNSKNVELNRPRKGFQVLNDAYARDGRVAYRFFISRNLVLPADRLNENNYQVIEESHGPTFEVLGDRHAKDRFSGYIFGNKIEGSHGLTFEYLGANYARDKNNIYFRETIIDGVDHKSFEVPDPEALYALDKSRVYYGGLDLIIMEDADRKTFKVINEYYALDKNRAYSGCKSISYSDPGSFQSMPDQSAHDRVPAGFAKDHKRVYKFEKPIKGADPKTFEIILHSGSSYQKDIHAVYHHGEPIKGSDPKTFLYHGLRFLGDLHYDAEDKNRRYASTATGVLIFDK